MGVRGGGRRPAPLIGPVVGHVLKLVFVSHAAVLVSTFSPGSVYALFSGGCSTRV